MDPRAPDRDDVEDDPHGPLARGFTAQNHEDLDDDRRLDELGRGGSTDHELRAIVPDAVDLNGPDSHTVDPRPTDPAFPDRVPPNTTPASEPFADTAVRDMSSNDPPLQPAADRFLSVVAVDGEVLFAGPSLPDVIGFDRDPFVGEDLLEYVHPSERIDVSDALSALATDRRVRHRLRHASGGYVWVESLVDEDLAPHIGGRVVTSRIVDVDRTFPEGFREFLEYSTDIVTVVDADGRVRYESPSVEDVLGYDQGSLVGQSPLGFIHPEDRPRVTERFYAALSDPSRSESLEYRYQTADGDWVWLESRTRTLPDDAVAGRLLINSRDVTERKRRERRLVDRNERLDRFASIVSHDLRNPLAIVMGSIEMATLNDDVAPLERGERAAERIDQLIGELLTLARQGDGIDEPTEFSLAGIAQDAWEVAGDPSGTLVVRDDPQLFADHSRLQQAFENLFRNAVEHGGEAHDGDEEARGAEDDVAARGSGVTVTIAATKSGIIVADDGPGIDPTVAADVFEPGVTTGEGGIGYGLDIVREIINAHGWSIRAVNDLHAAGADDDEERTHIPPDLPDGARFEIEAPAPSTADEDDPWIARPDVSPGPTTEPDD